MSWPDTPFPDKESEEKFYSNLGEKVVSEVQAADRYRRENERLRSELAAERRFNSASVRAGNDPDIVNDFMDTIRALENVVKNYARHGAGCSIYKPAAKCDCDYERAMERAGLRG